MTRPAPQPGHIVRNPRRATNMACAERTVRQIYNCVEGRIYA